MYLSQQEDNEVSLKKFTAWQRVMWGGACTRLTYLQV